MVTVILAQRIGRRTVRREQLRTRVGKRRVRIRGGLAGVQTNRIQARHMVAKSCGLASASTGPADVIRRLRGASRQRQPRLRPWPASRPASPAHRKNCDPRPQQLKTRSGGNLPPSIPYARAAAQFRARSAAPSSGANARPAQSKSQFTGLAQQRQRQEICKRRFVLRATNTGLETQNLRNVVPRSSRIGRHPLSAGPTLAANANLAEAQNHAPAGSGPAEIHLWTKTREQHHLIELPPHGRIDLPGEDAIIDRLARGVDRRLDQQPCCSPARSACARLAVSNPASISRRAGCSKFVGESAFAARSGMPTPSTW